MDYVFPETLKDIYPKIISIIDKEMKLTAPSTLEQRVALQLAVQMQRNAEAITAVNRSLLQNEALPLLRVQWERFVNLFYVLYAGPAEHGTKSSELANQYLSFQNYEIYKIHQSHRQELRTILLQTRHTAKSYDALFSQLKENYDEVTHKWPFETWKRWTPHKPEALGKWVSAHMPSFANGWSRLNSDPYLQFRHFSIHAHGSSLSDDHLFKGGLGPTVVTDQRSDDGTLASIAAIYSIDAWLAAADTYDSVARECVRVLWEQSVNDKDPDK